MDYKLVITEDGADLAIESGDIAIDAGLRTPVLVSLYSDARVELPEDLPAHETDPRGWWADLLLRIRMGSLLWTVRRSKITSDLLNQSRVFVQDALEWLVQGGFVEDITVVVSRIDRDAILIRVELRRGSATQGADLWESLQQEAVTFETPRLQVQILTA